MVGRDRRLRLATIFKRGQLHAWQVLLKREDLQPVFSFKLRGAYNKMAHLTPAERARGVICSSAGNHAQGVALAAQKLVRGGLTQPSRCFELSAELHAALEPSAAGCIQRLGRVVPASYERATQSRLHGCLAPNFNPNPKSNPNPIPIPQHVTLNLSLTLSLT